MRIFLSYSKYKNCGIHLYLKKYEEIEGFVYEAVCRDIDTRWEATSATYAVEEVHKDIDKLTAITVVKRGTTVKEWFSELLMENS